MRAQADYDERLRVPRWWWPVGFALGGMLAAELHAGRDGVLAVLPYALVGAALLAGLLALGHARVRVTGTTLHAAGAHLPLEHAGQVTVLDRAELRPLLGAAGDPAAYVLLRSWLPGAVRVEVVDPADPTPYWLVSSRRPEQLAAAVERGRADARARAARRD